MNTIRAQAGDTLDLICWRVLGTTAGGVVEATFELNRIGGASLAELGDTVAEGTIVLLPNRPAPASVSALQTVNLWD